MRKLYVKEINGDKITMMDIIIDKLTYNPLVLFILKCLRFIKRLFIWIPLIWKQENWDIAYLYDLIEFKLKDILVALEDDNIHEEKGVKRRVRQVKICLAYLDRYRNWPKYYDYPDVEWVPTEHGCYTMKYKPGDKIKADECHDYEKFNYDMFWKRFMQWHQGWWV